jgi:hypothetical protein
MKSTFLYLSILVLLSSCAQLHHVQIGEIVSHPNYTQQPFGLIGLFQMGPQTGNPVYSKDYARNLMQLIYEKCPSGKVTGLTSVRESRKYPVISGEIVKVTGFCLIRKGG